MPLVRRHREKVGRIDTFPVDDCPEGWYVCDGSSKNVATDPALFAFLGTKYGGDGVATFGLPDYRAEVLRGNDQGRGVDAGRVVGTWQDGQMQKHKHTGLVVHGSGRDNQDGGEWVGTVTTGVEDGGLRTLADSETGFAGGDINASENMVRNRSVLFCIKR